ncbi:TPA: helix-turn-helix transcriptional regulator [Staphylococcus aureus]|uniref:helix-turn-helix transcriptional regulator n=1 Tax=Staphylococcus aureus TaxID=1280 RepID=UPI0022EBEB13|nr:helix-turn-helix transcriptional regulator [Staphylococcus aureus]MDA3754309.1 helix-turn-helix transcriptional regulator [Staphylococcus aureus]MDA4836890.1 helix-turn-helix transcriptional regulator [Staphylococcus aureus]MDA5396572.1 helix-turn-helix transcriptional regulator [Staphylococcus aureus]MDA5402802.1 helix-turn-helix transcriptional regulator [Staphylococcus aureus]MDA5406549.1 helix-turn-helix transcriptional regulator [Staphylococcus aureus]
MAKSCLHILTNNEYATTRCQDGIVLFWPIDGEIELQKFRKSKIIEDDIYIINHLDVFSIKNNKKTIMLYLSSDWFAELGFTFFNYHYTAKLIKSSYNLKCLLLKLTYRYLDNQPLNDADVRKLQDIIKIIAKEASMDKKIAQNQYRYAYYGDLRDELEYIYQNVNQRLTLKSVADKLFVSKSNLSSQFHLLMGMGFKKYIDTLKIGKSIEILLTTDSTISNISEHLGFSSSSTYSKMFKSYMDITPNEYRNLSKYNKCLMLKPEPLVGKMVQEVKEIILNYIEHYKNHLTDVIHIDEDKFETPKLFQTVIQINTYTEMKLVFLEGIFKTLLNKNSQVVFFIMPSILKSKNTMSEEEKFAIIKTIIESDLKIAFNINDIETTYYVEEAFMSVFRQISPNELSNHNNYEVHFVFDLSLMEIRTIYRMILKLHNIMLNVKLGLNITCLFEKPSVFKSLVSQIKRLKFDSLIIDNANLSSPYLMGESDELLLKNILHFKNLKQVINELDIEQEKLIFLNVENHKLINNKERDLSNSAPLIYKTLSALYHNFDGFGLNIFDNHQAFNAMHLYDKNGFKTTLGLILEKFIEYVSKPKYENSYYSIFDIENYYCLVIYDWRVIESETIMSNFEDSQVYINFKNNVLNDKYLIVIETLDENSGNINHLISKESRDKYEWNPSLLSKIDNYLKPAIEIKEHNFSNNSLNINVTFNALYIIKIGKK